MSRTVLIGDVHGCFQETCTLLEELAPIRTSDRIIFLGDLIDRGPDSELVINLVRRRGYECVLGNHESRMLGYIHTWENSGSPTSPDEIDACVNFRSPEHRRTFLQLSEESVDWMKKRLHKYIVLPEHNAVAVHAGVVPGLPMVFQQESILLHGQMIPSLHESGPYHQYDWHTPTEWPSKIAKLPEAERVRWTFWTEVYKGPQHVFFGHTVIDGHAYQGEFVTGLDTGCCFGGSLSAAVLEEGQPMKIISVPAQKVHFGSKRAKTFQVNESFRIFG